MNTATQNLENDHVYILQLTEVMQKMVTTGATDINHFRSVVNIIRNFADGLHHKKEEDLLFPLFEQRTAGGHCAPVGVMLMEHEQGRAYVKGMVGNISLYENSDKGAIQLVYQNMLDYADLLQHHIDKENSVLFRMADNAFSEEDQSVLLSKFGEIELASEDGAKIEDFVAAIDELSKAYTR